MQFTEIIGQHALKEHFIQEIQSNKLAHAKLFIGEYGYGTLALALAYVRYLFCKNKTQYDSCNTCESCKKMNILQHPDLHFSYPIVLADAKVKLSKTFLPQWRQTLFENPYFDLTQWTQHIDPKGRRPVIANDESLEILKTLSLKSYQGGYKVMLIWGVDQMNEVAANKLLKILEEPPPLTLFLLIAENQERLLQTIVSRTQIVRVPRVEPNDLKTYLQEKHDLSDQETETILLQAEGNIIHANNLIVQGENNNFEWFVELMRVAYIPNVPQMIEWAEKLGEATKTQQTGFIQYTLHLLRQALLKNYTSRELLQVSAQEYSFLSKFAPFITGDNIVYFQELLNKSHYYIERNGSQKLIFTNIAFNVMRYLKQKSHFSPLL